MIQQFKVMVLIAWRNLFASFINFIIGGIIFFGTLILVTGGSVLSSVNQAMSSSIINSTTGHLQVYSEQSKEELSVYGNPGGRDSDISPVTNFPVVRKTLEALPEVKRVVPMGTSGSFMGSGNSIDVILERMRNLVRKQVAGEATASERTDLENNKKHLRYIVKGLKENRSRAAQYLTDLAKDPAADEALDITTQDAFWDDFNRSPETSLELLENRIAPLLADGDFIFLRYIGTDVDAFSKSFDRMRVVDGTAIPQGQRGILIGKFFYEEALKMKNARRLDEIRTALKNPRRKIQGDSELERKVRENKEQTREILLQLDEGRAVALTEALRTFLQKPGVELKELLPLFFDTTDENFSQRYEFFYKEFAPRLQLYRFKVGDTLTLKAFTRSGYLQSVNLKIYGTFEFTGLEKSPLTGIINLIDLVSFRDLYGYVTQEKAEETRAIQAEAKVEAVARENAEDALFGGDTEVIAQASNTAIDENSLMTGAAKSGAALMRRAFTQDELEDGVVLNAAVVLKEGVDIETARRNIQKVVDEQKLGLKVVDWRSAAGILGQLVFLMAGILIVSSVVLFIIAMIIINNSVTMAIMQRTAIIGTMRAVGAQRAFILGMVLFETLVLGLFFGLLGAGLGSVLVEWMNRAGIPVPDERLEFLFGGSQLFPTLSTPVFVGAMTVVVTVTLLSTFLPAFRATRISPIRAMSTDE